MSKIIWGYACISDLHPAYKTGSTSTLTYINRLHESQRGEYLKQKARANLAALEQLLIKNAKNKIKAYRMPDSLLPMADLGYYKVSDFASRLKDIGDTANKLDSFISFHPSQFFVLNSATPRVVDSAIHNFNIFAEILEAMELKNKPVLLTHVGARSTYASTKAACDAFCEHFKRLSPAAQSYFAVENDQSAHSVDSCLYISSKIDIPVVVDNAHYAYKPVKDMSFAKALHLASKTWKDRVQKIHLSSELEGSTRHAHADFIKQEDWKTTLSSIQRAGIDRAIVMVEAKKKDRAVQQLRLDNLGKK